MKPKLLPEHSTDATEILQLIQSSFAYMEGRVDPASSMHRLTIENIAEFNRTGEVWSFGSPIVACVFLKPHIDALYLSKFAISASCRGSGLARKILMHAESQARVHKKKFIELNTRVELKEIHLKFSKLGFKIIAEAAHKGYSKPTYIIMRKFVG